jgi:nitric oxide dioxygenase
MHSGNEARDWLDAADVVRIRDGFARVAANADGFTADFYARLFELAPTTRALFPDDLTTQREKLKHMLVMLIGSLDRPLQLKPALAALGDRHRSYGVVKADFVVVGRALLDTLAAHLGDSFTPADRAAWADLYGRITAVMTSGTQRNPATAPALCTASG